MNVFEQPVCRRLDSWQASTAENCGRGTMCIVLGPRDWLSRRGARQAPFCSQYQSQLVFQRAAVVMGNRSLFFLNYLILGILSELNDFFISPHIFCGKTDIETI